MIKVENLAGGYTSTNPIIDGINLEIKKGEFFALLGPNGSGKTTLFKLITGQLTAQKGAVYLSGKALTSISKLEKAKKMAVLSQEVQVSFDYTVEEIISLGRYPHQTGVIKQLSKLDRQIINDVMNVTKTSTFRNIQFRKLSGGEKQRVLLAKALAQEPEILLLDEPTNHLDVKHTFQMLDLLKESQQIKALTIFAILHDLNVAALYADRVALLHKGLFLDVGDVGTLRKEDQLKKVYEVHIEAQTHPTVAKPQLLMTPTYVESKAQINISNDYKLVQTDEYIHVQYNRPLRTISNGVTGDGIQWFSHFCNFHVAKDYNCSDPLKDIQMWMKKYQIPFEQAVGMMTAVNLKDVVIQSRTIEGVEIVVIVTAGVRNAVDITTGKIAGVRTVGTINTMVFIDTHFTDGALVNGIMSATEAKVKALQDLSIIDPVTNTSATGTSTDAILLATTQQGEKTPYAGSGTIVGKAIGLAVYEATQKAIRNYQSRQAK